MIEGVQMSRGFAYEPTSPKGIIRGTSELLALHYKGETRERSDVFSNFVSKYTLQFLEQASQGAPNVFRRSHSVITEGAITEAADMANVVFGYMRFANSQFLPMGFPRRGILQAPETEIEFARRLNEMIAKLTFLVLGNKIPGNLWSDHGMMRTVLFFQLGTELPLKVADDSTPEQELQQWAYKKIREQRLQANKKRQFQEARARSKLIVEKTTFNQFLGEDLVIDL